MSRRSALSAADVHLDLEPLLRAGSRTAASGILDTASAPEKAGVVVRREAASVLRKHLENTRSACALIADAVSMPPGSATSWRALVCELNTQLTVGLTNAPGGYRRHATPAAYQQVPVSAVEAYFGEACGIIARQDRLLRSEQLPGAWGIGLAAFAVWAINIRDYYARYAERASHPDRLRELFDAASGPVRILDEEIRYPLTRLGALFDMVPALPPVQGVHGDLHLSNIVLGSDRPYLVDFAWSGCDDHLMKDFVMMESSLRVHALPSSPAARVRSSDRQSDERDIGH